MKYVATSEPPVVLSPISLRLPFPSMPADLIGMFEATESMATHALLAPEVRRNRLQLVTRPPDAVWPYERRFRGYSLASCRLPPSPKASQRVRPARPLFVVT